MNLLLDTHVFLWWDDQDKVLNANARSVIADPTNQVFISAVSIWEIAIKRRLKKLRFRGSLVAAVGRWQGRSVASFSVQPAGPIQFWLVRPLTRRQMQNMPATRHGSTTIRLTAC